MVNIKSVSSSPNKDVSMHKSSLMEALNELSCNTPVDSNDVATILTSIFKNIAVRDCLVYLSQYDPFTKEAHLHFENNLQLLATLKQLKYFYNLPMTQLISCLANLCISYQALANWLNLLCDQLNSNSELSTIKFYRFAKETRISDYEECAEALQNIDPQVIYPTNIYRRNDGYVATNKDFTTFESTMTLTLSSTTKIRRNVLEVDETTLSSIYKPLGRCVAIIDTRVDIMYGPKLRKYFDFHNIKLKTNIYSGDEVDKDIKNVEKMLVDLKNNGVSRNEPVLIVGGGVIADIGGFACALYHRSTPYVMLCTSIVTGIDAGPSPRTCCDGFGFKNLYGAYNPPVVTITDRSFFKTLPHGWLRHGVAEIIKMASVKDVTLFELLEKAGPKLISTKFATDDSNESFDGEFEDLCDLIIGRAMASYIATEYANLWETHQCRPHAFGHTWSPGYELPAGMLHGHAVATGMGFGAYLSYTKNWINEFQLKRVMTLISSMELALWHPIMENTDMIYNSQKKMTEKRGGRLCAPVPKSDIGECGYIDDVSYSFLQESLLKYKTICDNYPRNGFGVEVHCKDVGLADPSLEANKFVSKEIAKNKSLASTIEV